MNLMSEYDEFSLDFALDMITSERVKDFRKNKILIISTPSRNVKVEIYKRSDRCQKTIDWVDLEYNTPFEKLSKNQSGY